MKKTILLLLLAAFFEGATANPKPTCKGTTKAGNPCKSTIILKNQYCINHNPQKGICLTEGCNDKMIGKFGDKTIMYCQKHAKPQAIK